MMILLRAVFLGPIVPVMRTADIDGREAGFIPTSEAAAMLGVTTRTMSKWAAKGTGPVRYLFSPRCARYRIEDVRAWVQEKAG